MGLPKILVGGVLIIDLISLSLTPSVDMETYTPISNSEVLSQLLRLKQYIETPTAQKPLWVRMSYDGETITTMGALYKEDGDPHFKLIVKILDYRLIIDVTFTQDEETLEWYIDTEDAKYLFTSNSQEVDSYIESSISSGAIKDALDLKANLSGAAFTGAISSPNGTFEELNGESNPSVKPLYYHPIYIIDNTVSVAMISCVIINNSSTPFTIDSFKALLESVNPNFSLSPVSGTLVVGSDKLDLHRLVVTQNGTNVYAYGRSVTSGDIENAIDVKSWWDTINDTDYALYDVVNKLN